MSKKDKETIKLLQDSLIMANKTHSVMTNMLMMEREKSNTLAMENEMLRAVVMKREKNKK